MKTAIIPVFCLLLATAFFACKKDSNSGNTPLDASKSSNIKQGEPVLFTLSQAEGKTVNWSVSPSARTVINSNGNQASILFGARGSYTVTGTSGTINASATVSVSDTICGGGGGPATTLPFVSGEQINITAFRVDSGSNSGLFFLARTANSYTCLRNSLLSTFTSGSKSYTIEYTGVSVPYNCTEGTAKASGFSSLYPISDGASTLTIKLNGLTYNGTVEKNGNKLTINWPYQTGVTISPTSL